jgi:predicted membrane-bound spermidine synthase
MISLPFSIVSSAGASILVGLCLTFFFGTKDRSASFKDSLSDWQSQLGTGSLWIRLGAGWLSFVVIYLLIGMIISPVVTPFYQSSSLELRIPPMQVIIVLQLARGGLLLLFTLPLLAFWRGSRLSFFSWFGSLLFFKDVLLGVAGAFWWPLALRLTHGLELTVDSFLLAGVYSVLLVARRSSSRGEP